MIDVESATLPTLYKKTSTGKIQMWRIEVTEGATEDDSVPAPAVQTTYGQVDGKKQTSVEYVREGKNIGRSNETTAMEQAHLLAQQEWDKKAKKGYVQSAEDAEQEKVDTNAITGGVNPMLAHKYDDHGHKIQYPCIVQPKLDGHRCVAIVQDGACTLWSRTRKPINSIPHIQRELERRFPEGTIILDGELYNHDYRDKFEQLTSKIRKAAPQPGHEVIQFWVYDLVDETLNNAGRQAKLARLGLDGPSVVAVATDEADDQEQMIAVFGAYVNAGFEGLMARNRGGAYVGKRSYDLQKVKVMQDAEFEVVAVEEGKGRMEGHAMFVCKTGEGKTFRVKMMGALDNLKQMYDEREKYVGRMLTVKYQKLSAENIPVFPIALRFREDV